MWLIPLAPPAPSAKPILFMEWSLPPVLITYIVCQKFPPIDSFLNPPKSPFFKGGLSKAFR
jgi:hypothetical protein